MMKFIKNNDMSLYWIVKDTETVASINIHYNFFSHSNYYTIGDKQFNLLKDAKAYAKENF